MKFYLYASAIGVILSAAWIIWLLGVRRLLRIYRFQPGAVLSVLQVVVVLALMQIGYRMTDYCLAKLGMTLPDEVKLFRHIWVLIWMAAMAITIQIFLDIRRMATPPATPVRPPNRPGRQSARPRRNG